MSSPGKEVEVNLSTASLFPWFSLKSTEWSANMAKKYGYEGLEILPGYSACWEYYSIGELSVSKGVVTSLHDSWKRDRRAEVEYSLSADTNKSPLVTLRSSLLRAVFPNEDITRKTLQGLENVYQAPVIFHWKEDERHYQKPILEVHPHVGMNPKQLISWAEEKPEKRGFTLDLSNRKIGDYLRMNGIDQKERKEVIRQLLPYTKEVHFQIGDQDELKQVVEGLTEGTLGQTLSLVKTERPHIPIVAELNPPILVVAGVSQFKLAEQAIDFIRKA